MTIPLKCAIKVVRQTKEKGNYVYFIIVNNFDKNSEFFDEIWDCMFLG
jgi:hypothetical protein